MAAVQLKGASSMLKQLWKRVLSSNPSLSQRKYVEKYRFRPQLVALEDRIVPAFLIVTTLDDSPAIDPTESAAVDLDGNISLRSAIQRVNAVNDPLSIIDFATAAPATDDMPVQPGLSGTISLDSPLPEIECNVGITGPGMSNRRRSP